MKKDEVKVGGLYTAKVSDKVVSVRIDSANSRGGWNATNTATGKTIRIKSAQRLRGAAEGDDAPAKAEKPASKKGEKPKGQRPAKPAKEKRVSALDAAARVLAKADKPMGAQELITAMAENGLWTSPGGKTPHATLYAAMVREISTKGKEARFKKVERGMFAING